MTLETIATALKGGLDKFKYKNVSLKVKELKIALKLI